MMDINLAGKSRFALSNAHSLSSALIGKKKGEDLARQTVLRQAKTPVSCVSQSPVFLDSLSESFVVEERLVRKGWLVHLAEKKEESTGTNAPI